MSYDFAIQVDTGGAEPLHVDPYFSDTHPAFESDGFAGTAVLTATGYARCGNYTSNVSPMWSRCLIAALAARPGDLRLFPDDGTAPWLSDLNGAAAYDLIELLRTAVEWGVENIDELREMNPENGWGNAEGAVTYLWDIQRHCEAHPRGSLYISS